MYADGGAEYLTDTHIVCQNGHREGTVTDKTRFLVRIDGDALLTIGLDAASELGRLKAERDRLKTKVQHYEYLLLQIERSACLRQFVSGKCICFSCEARTALHQNE